MLAAWIGIAGFVSADEIEALPTADERSAVFHALPVPPAGPFTPERAAAIVAQNDFNVTHYLLDLDFNDNAQRITGSVTITAKSVVPALAVVPLDLAPQMNVSGVTRNGTALPFLHDGDVLTVTLDSPVANGQSFEIVVSYSGVPVQRPPFDGFGWNKYRPSGGKMAWSLSQPENARIWWPSKDRADDKALVEEWWTVKGSWTATGNGTLQGVDVLESGRKRYRWRATHPLPTYLVSIAATDYVSFSSSYETLGGGSMPIDYYVYSEHLSDAQESFSRTPEMLEAFAGRFGEYPFVEDKYGMSAFPFLGGMEHPTNTSYGYENINGGHSRDFVIAHELAHQWFGDSVTPATADDLWLSEGFASYGEALWREHREGPDGLSAYMNLFRRDEFPGPLYPPETPFNITVYDKGAWALQMLRKRLGDDTFFAAMQSWHEQYRDKNASTAQFQAKMEAFHGESLDTFFAQWIYGEGQPDYTFGHRVARPEAGVWHAWVRVEQVQDGPVFEGPLDLTLETNQGDMVTHTVWNDSAEQYYRLVSDTAIASLHFDRANWALKIAATWDRPGDSDIDGVPNGADNCPSTANADQADVDNDLVGDACDTGEVCNDGVDDDGDQLTDCADPECADASNCIPEICDDGSDNDHDGDADCDDDECIGHPDCVPETCDDGADNNDDGLIDCNDPDCAMFHACVDEICDDAFDNDNDGDTDCDDDECTGHTDCIPEVCDDAADNDTDGLVDCDDPECAAFPDCVPEVCDDGLDNDGDGATDCADPECFEVHGCITEICNDAVDNDGDGDADCADDECADFHACIPEICDDAVDNDSDGATDCADGECLLHHSCLDENCTNGLDDDGDGLTDCDDEECSGEASCIDEICNDGQDNDGDGLIDCADPECADVSDCIAEICDDEIDNDDDGFVDCTDSECLFAHQCTPETCGNGFDDDGDGLTDCADEECADNHACIPEDCGNGLDDDGDGLTDCADEECVDVHTCTDEVCGNGSDDDFDGLTDCADEECADFHGCIDEICGNGADDDGDGSTDCADDECAALPECIFEICDNGVDDDDDGATDCDDDECAGLHGCIDEICGNATDDDGDGLTDCADEECAALPECIAEICDDASDNDGDGLTDCDDDECAGFHDCIDEVCDDSTDNDGDGLADCDDDECAGFHGCIDEICEDDIDNDGDGLTDCDDDECAGFHGCVDEICEDDTDNDGDGLTDCDDDECAGFHGCIDEICEDDTDNDGDGLTDCDDDECADFHGCIDEICDDDTDNDGDGFVDCDDSECSRVASCVPEDCEDLADNNGNGLIDCEDPTCADFHACVVEICDDGIDNDGDGGVDCDDDECTGAHQCITEFCTDNIDNDGDGAIDCADDECADLPACQSEDCGDGIDNDGDGQVDCNDSECVFEPMCTPENCGNGFDDDGDGFTDCNDPECADYHACVSENCGNEVDDDGDGLTDCDDEECVDVAACIEEVCDNGADDDFDGQTDCADDECADFHDCIEEICGNATDDDGDGLTDCDDDECAAESDCIDEICDNATDDDGDGLADCDDDECAGFHGCIDEVCDNASDDDGDGLADCDDDECAEEPHCLFERCDDDVDNDGDGAPDCADPDCEMDSACSMCPLPAGEGVERGRGDLTCFELATGGDTATTHTWSNVPFSRTIADPVVIVGPPTRNGHDHGVVQLRNIGIDGFQTRYMEWTYEDGLHTKVEEFPFFAVPAGLQVLANGTVIQAGRFDLVDTGSSAELRVTFPTIFDGTPTLILTMQTANGSQPVAPRAREVTPDGFTAALYEEEQFMNQHGVETVGYIAVWTPTGWGDLWLDGVNVPFLLQQYGQNQQFTPVLSWDLRYDEETSFDSEYNHATETVDVLAVGHRLFAQDVSTLESDVGTLRRYDRDRTAPLEWGIVRGVTSAPLQVPLHSRYVDPVVIVKAVSGNDLEPGAVRIEGVAEDRFRVRFQEWSYLDGVHAAEDLFYLVVESGRHDFAGLEFEAGTLASDATQGVTSFDTVTYATPFALPPIVFSSVQTTNDTAPVVSRVRAGTESGILITMQEEEASTLQHGLETLGWVAFEEGGATFSGRSFQVTRVRATDRETSFPFPNSVSRRFPSVVADISGFRGFDPAGLRIIAVDRDDVRLFVQEEQSFDAETIHLYDDVSVFIGD